MSSPRFAVYVTCLFLWKMAHATDPKLSSPVRQERGFASVGVGDNITLECFYQNNDGAWLHWFKQTPGQRPKLVSTFYTYSPKGSFHHEFENNTRFALDTDKLGEKVIQNHLTIFYLKTSDSATYYCAYSNSFMLTFAEGTVVSVQGSSTNIPALLHQSPSETIQPGGSVTLNCTVQTGTCDGQHSVYWFKDSEESHPALIYSDGGSTDQCERKSNTQTHTCDYNLPMESLNPSHAGTYYCAVASCGHILFGNRTKLDFKDKGDHLVLVYLLSGALILTTILVFLLGFFVYKLNKKNICQCSDSHVTVSAPSTGNTEGYQSAQSPYYAALNLNVPSGSRRQKMNIDAKCVYSGIKQ
ncbi:immunoglobulin kappa light chain-like [Pungitius pungitius]|uniref:immunoglobulin kappa light chain-like n=1 Tax=Pungitius pungitius TaxID=134920 RepID=UPI002E0DA211